MRITHLITGRIHKSYSIIGTRDRERPTDDLKSTITDIQNGSTSVTSVDSPAKRARSNHKWNCCISVPDSPDDPSATTTSSSERSVHKSKCLLSLCKYKQRTKSQMPVFNEDGIPAASPRYGTRIRVLFRVFGHWSHGRRSRQQQQQQQQQHTSVSRNKHNQVVPLSEDSSAVDGVQVVRPCSAPLTAPPSPGRLQAEASRAMLGKNNYCLTYIVNAR